MSFTKKQADFLGFNKRDIAVFEALKVKDLSFTELSKLIKEPRTTLYLTVDKLVARGFVRVICYGKRKKYKIVSHEELFTRCTELVDLFSYREEQHNKKFILRGRISSEYVLYKGKENLVALYAQFGELPRYSRIYAIQPNISALSVMKSYPYEDLVKVNQKIKHKKIIVEAILQENFLEFYADKLKAEHKPIKDIFEAYGGRLADTGYVSSEFFNVDSELMMTDSFAVIANWKELAAIEIRDKETIGMLKEFFKFIKNQSKKIDQNPLVKNIIETHTSHTL